MIRLGLTPAEAAALLGRSTASIYRAIKLGEIDHEVISGCIVIPAAPLIARFGEPVDVPLEAA
jgi:hypothetical protein